MTTLITAPPNKVFQLSLPFSSLSSPGEDLSLSSTIRIHSFYPFHKYSLRTQSLPTHVSSAQDVRKKKDSCPGEAQANVLGVFTWFILTGE